MEAIMSFGNLFNPMGAAALLTLCLIPISAQPASAVETITPEDVAMGKLRKSLVKPYKNRSVTWDLDDEGEVVRISKTSEGPIVCVKTKEPIRIGDKLA